MSAEVLHKAVKTQLLSAKVISFKDKFAELKIEDQEQTILWPIKYLPEDVVESSQVFLKIGSHELEEEERAAIARKLLEELVN